MTTAQHVGTRSLGHGAGAGLLITLAIHGALIFTIYWSHVRPVATEPEVRDLIVTRMVQLGKPREKFWLPRIAQPPRPKIQQPTIKIAEDPNAPPAPKEAPKIDDADISKDMKRALQKLKNLAAANVPEEEPEGSAMGSPAGTATTGSEGDEYATQIFEAIRANWNAATLIDEATVRTLKASVVVRIDADGALLEPTLRKPSGNDIFDDSCLEAVKKTGKVPPPPPAEAAKFKRGVSLAFDGAKS
jgi:TonB family protein